MFLLIGVNLLCIGCGKPKNEKHKSRKDLKDYTLDKDVEGMVPNASGEPMPNVDRKVEYDDILDNVLNIPIVASAGRGTAIPVSRYLQSI